MAVQDSSRVGATIAVQRNRDDPVVVGHVRCRVGGNVFGVVDGANAVTGPAALVKVFQRHRLRCRFVEAEGIGENIGIESPLRGCLEERQRQTADGKRP